jgi:hypothetical protein
MLFLLSGLDGSPSKARNHVHVTQVSRRKCSLSEYGPSSEQISGSFEDLADPIGVTAADSLMAASRMHRFRREKHQRANTAFPCAHEDTRGRTPLSRGKRQNDNATCRSLDPREDLRKSLGAMDNRKDPSGQKASQRRVNPVCKPGFRLPSRFVSAVVRSSSRCGRGIIGRVHQDMVEHQRAQCWWRKTQIALMHVDSEIVIGGIPPREIGVIRLELHAMQIQARNAGSQAKARRPRPAAKIKHPLARPRGNECRKQNWIGRGAVSDPRL